MIIIGINSAKPDSIVLDMFKKIISKTNNKISIIGDLNFHSSKSINGTLNNYIRELEKNKVDIVVVKLLPEYLVQGIYENIQFNLLVYNDTNSEYNDISKEKYNQYQKKIFQNLGTNQLVIINSDEKGILELLEGSKMYAITYGLNPKVTITASSIEETNGNTTLIYCIQRNIISIGKYNIEPQEFPVNILDVSDKYIYGALAAVTAALICDVKVQNISKLVL